MVKKHESFTIMTSKVLRFETEEEVWLEDSDNYHTDVHTFLIVGLHPDYPLKRSLIRFEDIPSSCKKIKWAKMHLYYFKAHKASWMDNDKCPFLSHSVEVRQVLKSWKEAEATRDERFKGAQWSSPYLETNDTDAKSSVADSKEITKDTPYSYIEWDITSIVGNWINGHPNYGVLLSVSNEDALGRDVRFYDRRNPTEVRPYLSVCVVEDL